MEHRKLRDRVEGVAARFVNQDPLFGNGGNHVSFHEVPDELARHAKPVTIDGSEQSVTMRIPTAELLMAMKLHSGRLTDARDVVALVDEVDFDRVADYVDRGDREQLRAVLERVRDTVGSEDFRDAYKACSLPRTCPRTASRRSRSS